MINLALLMPLSGCPPLCLWLKHLNSYDRFPWFQFIQTFVAPWGISDDCGDPVILLLAQRFSKSVAVGNPSDKTEMSALPLQCAACYETSVTFRFMLLNASTALSSLSLCCGLHAIISLHFSENHRSWWVTRAISSKPSWRYFHHIWRFLVFGSCGFRMQCPQYQKLLVIS